jgi:hypothetical protein
MASAGSASLFEGLGALAPAGSRGRAPGQGGFASLKLKALCLYESKFRLETCSPLSLPESGFNSCDSGCGSATSAARLFLANGPLSKKSVIRFITKIFEISIMIKYIQILKYSVQL